MNDALNIVRVSEYLDLVNGVMREHIPSDHLAIEGEVSDFRIAQGKWVSFDLKDEEAKAVLKCFMTTWQMRVPLEDGMRIQIMGYPKIYERFGSFKMNVQSYTLVGEGALGRAYKLLKEKLEAEGLFSPSRKRPLVKFPARIGLITSRDAAAYGDFLRILNNRWGGVDVLFHHVHVQGKEAVREIVAALAAFEAFEAQHRPDVVVLTRGGGGLEDLHAFNDEDVARAVFTSAIPVVCGVGHERDESLCDFVADVRASTPSNAAERVVPRREDVRYEIRAMALHMETRLHDQVKKKQDIIDHAARMIGHVLERQKERFQYLLDLLLSQVEGWLIPVQESVEASRRLLVQLDPERVLARGFSIVRSKGAIVRDASRLETGQEVAVQLAGGSFDAQVIEAVNRKQDKLF